MNEFKREERYIVIKLKDLNEEMLDELRGNLIGIRTRECVVVEPHHPHYEETWENVRRVTEGELTLAQERDALAAHVERLSGILFDTFAAIEDGDIDAAPYDAYRNAHNDTPTTSLVSLIAEKQSEASEDGMIQGGVMAAAMMAGQCEVTAREVLHAFGVTSGEGLRGCAEYDIARLIEHRVQIPGLHAAWQEARREERRQAEGGDS